MASAREQTAATGRQNPSKTLARIAIILLILLAATLGVLVVRQTGQKPRDEAD